MPPLTPLQQGSIRSHFHMKGQIIDPDTGEPSKDTASGSFAFIFDGGGGEIAVAKQQDIRVPFDCTLTGWSILADQAGAVVIDVWKDTYANYPATDDDSITNGNEPEIAASSDKANDDDLSDWGLVELAEGDCLRANVDSCSDITRATLMLKFVRT